MNVSILRGKTHMILTLSHPNMTRVGERELRASAGMSVDRYHRFGHV